MDASLCIFAERKKRPKELQYEWWVERQFGKIFRGLEELSAKLSNRNYFYKNDLTIADIAVASALGYVGLRFSEDFDWMKKYPDLANFYNVLLERPSFKDTIPKV